MLEIVSRLADDVSGSKARAAARVQGAQACSVLYDQILHSVMFPALPVTASTPALPAQPADSSAALAEPQAATEGALIAAQRAYASGLQVIEHGRRGLPADAWALNASTAEASTALATREAVAEPATILPWEQLLARMAVQQRLST